MASISSHLSFSNAGKHFSVEIIDRSIFQLREVCFLKIAALSEILKMSTKVKLDFSLQKFSFRNLRNFLNRLFEFQIAASHLFWNCIKKILKDDRVKSFNQDYSFF